MSFSIKIREDRNNRVVPEPEEGTTIIIRYGSLKFKRKFKTTALFQMHTLKILYFILITENEFMWINDFMK